MSLLWRFIALKHKSQFGGRLFLDNLRSQQGLAEYHRFRESETAYIIPSSVENGKPLRITLSTLWSEYICFSAL